MRVRLGINNCFAVKRWPRPEDWASVVHDLGLDLVELSLDLIEDTENPDDLQRSADQIRAALDRYGLTAPTVFTGLRAYSLNLLMDPDPSMRRRALDWYSGIVDLTARLGARAAGGHVGAMSVGDWTDPDRRARRWAELKHDLAELAARAKAAGLGYLLIENLASHREPSTIAGVSDLLSDGDDAHVPIRLCLDVGHQCVPGTSGEDRDPYAWLTHFGAGLPEVQLQQTDGLADHHWPFTSAHSETGLIGPGPVLETLADAGAEDVMLVLEVIPPFEADDRQVLADLSESVTLWTDALGERGFR